MTTILLDIFEDQLDIGKLVVMDDARRLLDDQLRNLNRRVLDHGGHMKMTDAKKHAERQYEKFNAARKLERQREADRLIAELKTTGRTLPKSKIRRQKYKKIANDKAHTS